MEQINKNTYKNNTNKYILNEKKILRQQILTIRDNIPQTLRAEKSRHILEHLYNCAAYQKAEQILSYVSFRSEADTMPFLEQVLQDGKELYCPLVCGKEMDFYRLKDLSELNPGAYGILEPPAYEENRFRRELTLQDDRGGTEKKTAQILMVVPGAVFDRKGFRIGYGGGYYDKFLANMRELQKKGVMTTAALLFSEQLVDGMPREVHDLPVEQLIMENGIIYTT